MPNPTFRRWTAYDIAKLAYARRMSKAPLPATTIKFEAMLTAGNEWQVVATCPTAQKKQIGGFKSEAEAVAWIGSPRCLAWIKVQGYE
jgi:hypothetical protein